MRPLLVLVAVVATVGDARAASPSDALQVLLQNCAACHGQAQLSGLDLRTRDGLLRGGSRGPAIQPGDAESSLLYRAVVGDGALSMPPEPGPLPAESVTVLKRWIDSGAEWPQGDPASEGGGWWSFEPVERPPLPDDPTGWSRSPIDRFIAAKHREGGLEPVGEAGRRAWIRRATYDLHGLPPDPADVEAFLRDDSDGAYEAAIDRLLKSDRYGERWGRLWLDVVRYADSGGFETDIYFPDAWRYRDYVIQSFNDDKPFDRFVQEQLAADEIWPDDIELRGSYEIPEEKRRNLEARIGTGMYTIGTVYHEAALNGHQLRYEWLVDAVDVTGEAFLGLTLGCARCHDHKFDPISQREYHQLMAYFAGSEIRRVPAVHKMSEFGYYSAYPKQLKVFDLQRAIKALDSAVRKRLEESIVERFDSEVVGAYRVPRSKRTAEQQALAAPLERALTEAGLRENPAGYEPQLQYTPDELDRRRTLVVQLGEAAARANFELPTATVLGKAEVAYPVRMTQRGDWKAAGDTVLPGLPRVLSADGREEPSAARRALANWLTDPGHPLLARVMVNRIWQGHFGRGIVGTPNNFGRQGDPPSHPKLLDWLAAEFVDSGWSIKAMHRLIMLSSTYRLSTSADSRNMQGDPENRFFWRMNRRRLDAEGLRDSVLWAAGTLNLKMGGRPVLPPLSEEERLGMWNRDAWPESVDPAEHNRRSVYVYAKRQFPYPMFKSFDMPDPAVSCGRRAETTVAPQALTLLNSEFMLRSAEAFAERLSDAGGPQEQVDRAWMVAFSRPPTEREREQAAEMLSLAGPREFALMLLNMNEFAYVD
ncbi:MAG: PSD1 and planctomycete cytochrome C domain-containing protein [Bryobacterales bacterium]|nr:PSD1 and planctomycete cytochrome C domain-containing protein [Bryobacterales bacterium]